MVRVVCASLLALLLLPATVPAQSLFIPVGERAAEGSAGWSVGPFSQGLELQGGLSPNGRWDVGFGLNFYSADFGGDEDTTVIEWTPSVRYFLFKEQDDQSAASLAVRGQFVQSNFDGDDEGWYVLGGAELYKQLSLGEGVALYPYVGFSVAAESYAFGGADAERAVYLTRQFGVHGLLAVADGAWLRITAEEHSFRRETFRAVRVGAVWRF